MSRSPEGPGLLSSWSLHAARETDIKQADSEGLSRTHKVIPMNKKSAREEVEWGMF